MFDEAGANWDAVEKIFGKNARANRSVSCKFHFFQCARRQASGNWSEKAKSVFNDLVRDISKALTPYLYDQARRKLQAFVEEEKSKRGHIIGWFKWWHQRRTHIFDAFKCDAPLTPTVNLAEVGHSKWAKKGAYRLSLAVAAEEDVAEAILLSKKLTAFGCGSYKGGAKRSQTDRLRWSHSQQVARAKAFGDEVANSNVESELYNEAASSRNSSVDPNCSHRATKKGQKRRLDDLQSSDSDDDSEQEKRQSRDGRFRSRPSKAFQRSLEKAKTGQFSLVDSTEPGKNERSFTLKSGSNVYEVIISKSPTCDCPFSNNVNVCKHVIHVLLKYFKIKENDYLIYQKTFTSKEVEKLYQHLDVQPQSILNATTGTRPCDHSPSTWVVTKLKNQPGPKPSCASYSCRKKFLPGDLCIAVEGLYTPPHKDQNGKSFKVKRTFRFCVKKECVPSNQKVVISKYLHLRQP